MTMTELLDPAQYARIPWKNGRGELVVMAQEGHGGWQDRGIGWHFGSTHIREEGPFSDYTGYDRLQVVIEGRGLVLVARDGEIDLRAPLVPQRYDGGLPVRTRLEHGPVRVVNLIFDRARFTADMVVVRAGESMAPPPQRLSGPSQAQLLIYAPSAAEVVIDGQAFDLAPDHALRVRADARTEAAVRRGTVVVGRVAERP